MTDYSAAIAQAEKKYGLPAGILAGQLNVESGGDPNAVSNKGALGLMQIMPDTARRYGINPNDPSSAIDGAARIMRDNLKAANGDPTLALRFYQGGMDKSRWGKQNAAYAGKVYSAMPGDSGDLTAMGFSTPGSSAQPDDSADMSAAGLSAVPSDTLKQAQALVNSYAGTPQPDQMDAIQKGVQPFLKAGDRQGAIAYLAQHGQTPKDPSQIDAAIAQYAKGGKQPVSVVNVDTQQLKPSDSVLTNLEAGADQGISDVVGTIGKGAQWLENKVPVLRSIDQGVGNAIGTQTADQVVNQANANNALYNATAGQTTAGEIGRIGGNLLMAAPMMGVAGAAAEPLAARALGQGAANFLAGAGGDTMLSRGASMAANGAVQGASFNALTGNPIAQGAAGGAALGPAAGLVGAGANKLARAVVPAVDTATADLARKAQDFGINLRADQVTDNPLMKRIGMQLAQGGKGGIAEDNSAQRAAFTRAVGQTFGADADSLTPQVMQDARQRISNVYNDVGSRTTLDLNPGNSDFLNNVSQTVNSANLGPQNASRAQSLIDEVMAKITPDGTMSGTDYKTLTSQGSMLSKAASSPDREYAGIAKTIRDELNQALTQSATPQDAAALAKANLQWKNMRTVERLVANSPDGQINPALLNRPVTTSFKNRAYTGAGDLGDLADIGQHFIKSLPDSGTAANIKAQRIADGGSLVGAMAGYGLGHALGVPVAGDVGLALLGAGRGTVSHGANMLMAKGLQSPRVVGMMLNNAGSTLPDIGNGLATASLPATSPVGNMLVRAVNDNMAAAPRAAASAGANSKKKKGGN